MEFVRKFVKMIQDLLHSIGGIDRVVTEQTFEYCVSVDPQRLDLHNIFKTCDNHNVIGIVRQGEKLPISGPTFLPLSFSRYSCSEDFLSEMTGRESGAA